MKKNGSRKLNILLLTAIILPLFLLQEPSRGLFCTVGSASASAASISTEKDATTLEDYTAYGSAMVMTIDYGYNHFAKYGRYMNVTATVTNDGENFEGWLQVIAPKAEDNFVYRKEVKIDAKDTETISLSVPIKDDSGLVEVKMIDKEQKTIVEKTCSILIGNYDEQAYIGILSDEQDKLEYLDTLATKTFPLDENNISDDYTALDLLDIIVINHYDTNRLSEKQLGAIETWVAKGGTLVIGTGEYGAETLAQLGEDYDITASMTTKNYDITFGLNEELLKKLKQAITDYEEGRRMMLEAIKSRNDMLKTNGKDPIEIKSTIPEKWSEDAISPLKVDTMNKEIAEIQLKGSSTQIIEQKCKLLQTRSLGYGMIQLFSFDLGLTEEAYSLGVALLVSITDNMSSTRHDQLAEEYYGVYSNYEVYNGMSYTDTKNIPNVTKYIIILLIYIVVVGPITYFILKKLDKRILTWIVVPVLAIIFTLIVYLVGSSTRINEPYIGYVEILNYQEDSTVEDKVYFSLTAPYNYKYTIAVDNKYEITELSRSGYNYYMNNTQPKFEIDLDRYMSAINFGANQTILEVNNNPAFSPIYYQTTSTYSQQNQLTYDVHYVSNDIYGTVTNEFEFDLINAIYIGDGYLIHLGEIKQGQTVSLEDKEKLFLSSQDIFYNNTIINRFSGGNGEQKDNTAEVNRKSDVMYYLGEHSLLDNQNQSYVVGFLTEDAVVNQGGIVEELTGEMDSFGTKVVMIPIQVDYTKGSEVFVPSIDEFMDATQNYYDSYYAYRYLNNESKTAEYILPEADNIISFEYLSSRNQDFESEYQRDFEGKIYFKNNMTGEFDEVFLSGVGSSVKNPENYITENNTITIRYDTDMSLQGYQMLLPYISYWKEADRNAEN